MYSFGDICKPFRGFIKKWYHIIFLYFIKIKYKMYMIQKYRGTLSKILTLSFVNYMISLSFYIILIIEKLYIIIF